MPTSDEHLKKYQINKDVLNTALDTSNSRHYDWIATICFYASLHIIEAQFAKESIHNRTHTDREDKILENDHFSRKLADRYKQLSTYSRVARYGPATITLTQASNSLSLLKKIEDELLEIDRKQT